jgi:hypothetical protein
MRKRREQREGGLREVLTQIYEGSAKSLRRGGCGVRGRVSRRGAVSRVCGAGRGGEACGARIRTRRSVDAEIPLQDMKGSDVPGTNNWLLGNIYLHSEYYIQPREV